jgi:hypothetical protein
VRSSTVPKNFMNGCLSSPGGRNAHAAAKSWHRGVIRRVIHVDGALVTAVLACHEQARRGVACAEYHRAGRSLIPNAREPIARVTLCGYIPGISTRA